MKLVLAGSRRDYERFIRTLDLKGKDIREYRYVRDYDYLRGYYPNQTELIKLGSFSHCPDRDSILAYARSRGFDVSFRTRRRDRLRGMSIGTGIMTIDEPGYYSTQAELSTLRERGIVTIDGSELGHNETRVVNYTGEAPVSVSLGEPWIASEREPWIDSERERLINIALTNHVAFGVQSMYLGESNGEEESPQGENSDSSSND